MKTSIENRVKEAQRVIQRDLMFEDCSVNLKPLSFNGKKIFNGVVPVAVINMPNENIVSKISSKLVCVINDFDLCGLYERNSTGEGYCYSIYARMIDESAAERLTFKDIWYEIRLMWQEKTFRI